MFLKHYLHIEGTDNTNLIALVGVAYIVGRGLNVLVSALRIPVTIMLYLNIVLLFAGSALILFISPSSAYLSTLITVAVVLMGLGYASSLPGNLRAIIPIELTSSTTKNCFPYRHLRVHRESDQHHHHLELLHDRHSDGRFLHRIL